MEKKRKPRRSAAEWSDLVDGWEASGESAARYAARLGLNAGTLYWWRSKLSKGAEPAPRRPGTARSTGHFAAVVVKPSATVPSPLEVLTPSGHRVRVQGTVDAATLHTVLKVLASC